MADLFDASFLKKLELLTIAARRAFGGQSQGDRRSRQIGSSVEFADYRPYSPGDDFRRIDWNAYARFDSLVLKLFRREEDLHVILLCDASASMDFGDPNKFDYARRAAAALAYIALHGGDRVSVMLLGRSDPESSPIRDALRSRRGGGAIFEVFRFLESARCEGRFEMGEVVSRLLAEGHRPGVVVLISDMFFADDLTGSLRRLAYERQQPMLLHILSPEEITPSLKGDLQLVDSETGGRVEVSASPRLMKAYDARLRAFRDGILSTARTNATECVFASTGDAFEDVVLTWMRKANILA